MRTGTAISAAGHAGVIALALFGLPWFSTREEPPIKVTDVSFVTEAEFQSAQAAAEEAERIPDAPPRRPAAQAEVLPEPTPPPAPEAAAPEVAPESEVAPEPAPAEVATLEPQFNPENPFAAATPEAVTLVPPPAPVAPLNPPRPRPVERIVAAPPAPIVEPEAQPEPAPTPAPAPAPVAEATPPALTGELAAVAPPRARPASLDRPQPQQVAAAEPEETPEPAEKPEPKPTPKPAAPAPKPVEKPESKPTPKPDPKPAAKPAEKPATKPAAAPKPADSRPAGTPATPATKPTTTAATPASPAQGGSRATSLPVGPPMTGAEKDGLKLAIQRCWSMPAVGDLTDLKITVAATLEPDGTVIASSIRMIEPASPPDGRFQMAFRAASTALRRCGPYTLPAEKYAQWRNVEIVFNPEGMVSW